MNEVGVRRIIRKLEQRRALEDMVRLAQELKLCDLPPEVCVTHKRFIPCYRSSNEHSHACVFSARPEDIEMVREFQSS